MLEQPEVSQPVQQEVLGDVDQRGAAPGGPLGCVPGQQARGQVCHRPAPWSSRATWLGCSGRTVSTTPQNRSVCLTVARGPNQTTLPDGRNPSLCYSVSERRPYSGLLSETESHKLGLRPSGSVVWFGPRATVRHTDRFWGVVDTVLPEHPSQVARLD